MSSFALDLQAFAAKAQARADEAVGVIVTNIAAELDIRSPVGDGKYWKHKPPASYVGGHFRANWQMGVNSVPSAEIAGVDPSGSETQARIHAVLPENAAGNLYSIVNNAPYAQALEYGHSRQAPQGMVGLTVTKFQQIVNEAVGEAKAAHP